jgi:hypothetical protein
MDQERLDKVFQLLESHKVSVSDVLMSIQGLDWALCGGVAVAFWVTKRSPTVRELDILISEEDVEEAREMLRDVGCVVGGYGGVGMNSVGVTCRGLKIDLIIAERSWEREALLKSAKAGKFRVVRPEYLILMKLKAGRDKDIEDVVLLSRVVDVEKTRKLVKRYLGDDYEEDFESLAAIGKAVGYGFGKERMGSWGVGD